MKRKLLIMLVIFTLLFSNFAFAAAYSKNDSDKDLKDVAKILDSDDTYIGTQYTAESKSIDNLLKNVRFKVSGMDRISSPINISLIQERLREGILTVYSGAEDEGYRIILRQEGSSNIYKEWLEIDSIKAYNSYIVYKNAINYNNKNYDIKIKVKSIKTKDADNIKYRFLLRAVQITSGTVGNDKLKIKECSIRPEIVVSGMENLGTEKAELSVDYTIGSYDYETEIFTAEEPISGLFTLGEIDYSQGISVDNWKINTDKENANIFIKQKLADLNCMKYQANSSSTYFYTLNKENMSSDAEDIYLLMDNVTNIPMTLTFDGHNAGAHFIFNSNLIKKQDQEQIKVTFNPQGGTPTPDIQYINKGKVVATPTEQLVKDGYVFTGWYTDKECKNKYDFSTAVEEDMTLYAGWEAIKYNITYVLNDGINDSSNPTTYTKEDTVTFKSPTKENSTFLGWYENSDFSGTSVGSISNRTGDITLYAKWETNKINNVKYKVEHYKEENGKYILATTEELEAEVGKNVTAIPKEYDGYKENTTYAERKENGTVKEDESLVLKLYYDKKQYQVTFDAQGGEEAEKGELNAQIIKYNEKATKPTNPAKNGYEFEYWYYKKDGKEIQYNFDDSVTENLELIAKWKTKSSGTSITEKESSTIDIGKKDSTTANKILPNTGSIGMILIISAIIVVTVFLGARYFKLKNDMK